MTLSPFMAGVPEDPMPWLTQRFRDYGVYDPDVSDVLRMSRVLGACQSTVNALQSGTVSFRVKFSGTHGSAFTDGRAKEVVIGIKAALDPDLTEGQRAAILIATVAHEVGHVNWSVTMQERLAEHYKMAGGFKQAWAAKVFNIVHDIHLEHWLSDEFSVIADLLRLKSLYYASPWRFDGSRNVTRYGALINATLYPHATDWTVSDEAREFKAFADAWAEKCKSKSVRRLPGAVEVIEEALAFLRYETERDIPEDEKPMTKCEPEESDEDEEGEDDEDEDFDSDPAEGEDEDEEDEGEGSTDSEEDEDEDEDTDEGVDVSPGGSDPDEDEADPEGDDDSSEGEDPTSLPPSCEEGEAPEPSDETGDTGEDTFDENDDLWRTGTDKGGKSATFEDGQPAPTLHGDMHTADDAVWQDAIDSYVRNMTSERDRFVVGGDAHFMKREMRIVRIRK